MRALMLRPILMQYLSDGVSLGLGVVLLSVLMQNLSGGVSLGLRVVLQSILMQNLSGGVSRITGGVTIHLNPESLWWG